VRAGHIGSLPFRGLQAFFERDAVRIEKPPERTAAGSNPLLAQFRNGLDQGQVVRDFDAAYWPIKLRLNEHRLDSRRATSAYFCLTGCAQRNTPPNMPAPRIALN
jgi:hypothetical protein